MLSKVKILLFDDVELLDFAGPLEVFGVAQHLANEKEKFRLGTMAFESSILVDKTGLEIIPKSLVRVEPIDLLIIPGGKGSRDIISSPERLQEIDKLIKNASHVASVCTGALILAKLGYLKNKMITTHPNGLPTIKEIDKSITCDLSQRFIENGKFITSAGISAGIDMSLFLIEKFWSKTLRTKVEEYMVYESRL